ncbi:hypothetical protein ACFL1H_04535 [Nanoarchaeota archaeon]
MNEKNQTENILEKTIEAIRACGGEIDDKPSHITDGRYEGGLVHKLWYEASLPFKDEQHPINVGLLVDFSNYAEHKFTYYKHVIMVAELRQYKLKDYFQKEINKYQKHQEWLNSNKEATIRERSPGVFGRYFDDFFGLRYSKFGITLDGPKNSHISLVFKVFAKVKYEGKDPAELCSELIKTFLEVYEI